MPCSETEEEMWRRHLRGRDARVERQLEIISSGHRRESEQGEMLLHIFLDVRRLGAEPLAACVQKALPRP
jgi:hypothetical protein